jgi:glutathione-regulated potassium-efflux system ancillary protein KefF
MSSAPASPPDSKASGGQAAVATGEAVAQPGADTDEATDVLVLVAHPHMALSRANMALMRAAASTRPGGPGRIRVRDLYALYPDYLIDVATEQAELARAKLVVWQHPIHWYNMPPLMKLWVDEVLAYGWAYGPGGQRLQGKDLWLVATTGGPHDSYHPGGYNRYFFDAFLPPYEQTAALCGMRFLPPLMLHAAHRASDADLARHADLFSAQLASYPAWPELDELGECPACEVPAGVRPATLG